MITEEGTGFQCRHGQKNRPLTGGDGDGDDIDRTPAAMDQKTAETAVEVAMSTDELNGFADQWVDDINRSTSPGTQESMDIGKWALQ